MTIVVLDALDDDRRRHAARGAHGDEAIATARTFEFIERGSDQDRPGGADRVAQRHRADRTSTRLNSSHYCASRMPSSACHTKRPERIYANNIRTREPRVHTSKSDTIIRPNYQSTSLY